MPGGFKIEVHHGLGNLIATLDARPRDIQAWTKVALNETAKDVQAAEVAKMAEVFDRPTRFTLTALTIDWATAADLTATVRFKEGSGVPAGHYLRPQVEGGKRAKKSHERRLERAGILRSDEYCVPGKGLKLDASGNMPGGMIERILSQLGAAEQWSGYTANATKKTLARAQRKGIGRYFVLRRDASDTRYMRRQVASGIYWRKGAHDIVPVLMFVKAPRYSKRLPFNETAQETVSRNFARRFREAVAKYPARISEAA
jgi:hypothetical protein